MSVFKCEPLFRNQLIQRERITNPISFIKITHTKNIITDLLLCQQNSDVNNDTTTVGRVMRVQIRKQKSTTDWSPSFVHPKI